MTMTHIETVTVGSGGAASIEFSAISGDFTDLLIVMSLRSSRTGAIGFMAPYINGSTSNQTVRRLYGSGSTAVSNSEANNWGVIVTSQVDTANTFASVSLYIPNYTSSSNKSFSIDWVTENNATQAYQGITAGLWTDTNPVTSIQLKENSSLLFVEHSTASLFGITAGSDGIVTVS